MPIHSSKLIYNSARGCAVKVHRLQLHLLCATGCLPLYFWSNPRRKMDWNNYRLDRIQQMTLGVQTEKYPSTSPRLYPQNLQPDYIGGNG